MPNSERYRTQAQEMARRAKHAKTPAERAGYEQLADAWFKLAADATEFEEQLKRTKAPKVRGS